MTNTFDRIIEPIAGIMLFVVVLWFVRLVQDMAEDIKEIRKISEKQASDRAIKIMNKAMDEISQVAKEEREAREKQRGSGK
jgi:hypothetical protein